MKNQSLLLILLAASILTSCSNDKETKAISSQSENTSSVSDKYNSDYITSDSKFIKEESELRETNTIEDEAITKEERVSEIIEETIIVEKDEEVVLDNTETVSTESEVIEQSATEEVAKKEGPVRFTFVNGNSQQQVAEPETETEVEQANTDMPELNTDIVSTDSKVEVEIDVEVEEKTEVADSIFSLETPEIIGAASKKLLNTDIEIKDDYGQGRFFENPSSNFEKYINQGYASLNVFHYADAYRSFRMATLEEQSSVQGLIGLAFSIIQQDTSPNAVKHIIQILNQIEKISSTKDLSEKEDAWFGYIKSYFAYKTGTANHSTLNSTISPLKDSYFKLMNKDGENIEAQAFVHWTIFNQQTLNLVINSQKKVLEKYPNHAGANHYLLHINEMLNSVEEALPHGEVLAVTASGSGHALHMLAHLLPQSGQWDRALEYFLKADKIHIDYGNINNVSPYEDWHYAHNLDLLAATYLGLNQAEKAYETWSLAMRHDGRAISKAVGILVATNKLDEAEKLISENPSWGPYVSGINFEIKVLKDTSNIVERAQKSNLSVHDEIVNEIVKFKSDSKNENELINKIKRHFTSKLTSGGFDGWSNGFVELLRVQSIVKALGLTTLEEIVDELIKASREGKL